MAMVAHVLGIGMVYQHFTAAAADRVVLGRHMAGHANEPDPQTTPFETLNAGA
jgi:ABC-type uncharacterized transport system ATPase subunit